MANEEKQKKPKKTPKEKKPKAPKEPKKPKEKTAGGKLKLPEMLKRPIDFFLSHRLLTLAILVVLTVLIAIFVLLSLRNKGNSSATRTSEQTEAMAEITDFSIVIPPSAFPYTKDFRIRLINAGDPLFELKSLSRFTGNIYELSPVDGRDDLALVPMLFRYNFPTEFYFGTAFNNIDLYYIDDPKNPIAHPFSGAEIKKIDETIVVEARSYHGSVIGIRVSNPEKVAWGFQKKIEKQETLKPHLLIVPGVDRNFLGFLPNTISNVNPQGNNIWEVAFPDRTIWSYSYPLVETRSLDYVSEATSFFEKTLRTSYVVFEATKLAQALQSYGKPMDIIAHGVGGLIVRYAIEKFAVENVRKVVLISTPNGGTNIVNPSFLSLLYGKEKTVLAGLYGLEEDTIRFIEKNNLSYLEKVNAYASEILPDSQIVEELSQSIRPDIEYAFIGGSSPGFQADIETSQLAKFYPELTVTKGDGVVSIYSALLPTIENPNALQNVYGKVFDYSFYENYVQKDTLLYIQQFLEEGIEEVIIPEYQDDLYREWSYEYPDSVSTGTETLSGPLSFFEFSTISTQTYAQATMVSLPTPSATTGVDIETWKVGIGNGPSEEETFSSWATRTVLPDSLTAGKSTADGTRVEQTAQGQSGGPNDEKIASTLPSSESATTTHAAYQEVVPDFSTPTTGGIHRYVPGHQDYYQLALPENFYLSNRLVHYPGFRVPLPEIDSPYGFVTSGSGDFIFDAEGVVRIVNGLPVRIFKGPVEAFTLEDGELAFYSEEILYRYVKAHGLTKSYPDIRGKVRSMAFAGDRQYYLVDNGGLILETPASSFRIPGMTGKIILYGVYPYILTDIGLYLFDGKEIAEIYKPTKQNEHFLDGLLKQSRLFILTSAYRLVALSLDGKIVNEASSNQIGGFKLLSTDTAVYAVGRNKVAVVFLSPKPSEGSYIDLKEYGEVIDAQIRNEEMMILTSENGQYALRKIGLMP